MGRLFLVQLDGRTYSCKHCRSHLALSEELISKSFHCKNGRAYLFNTVDLRVHTLDFGRDWKRWSFGALVVGLKQRSGNTSRSLKHALLDMNVNVFVGPLEDRMMTTGMHTVADIFCNCCGRIVGWKYEAAYEKSQKYKEGKFILERGRMVDGGDGRNFLVDTPVVGSDADDI